VAFVFTFVEAILTLLLVRWTYRVLKRAVLWLAGKRAIGPATVQTGD